MPIALFLLFNHQLTDEQRADAFTRLSVTSIVPLPDDLQEIWSAIPPDTPEIASVIEPIRAWLSSQGRSGDYVLIQGDFGACCLMVGFAMSMGLVPVYSTTVREAVEEPQPDGSVKLTHQFRHRIFRKYGV